MKIKILNKNKQDLNSGTYWQTYIWEKKHFFKKYKKLQNIFFKK